MLRVAGALGDVSALTDKGAAITAIKAVPSLDVMVCNTPDKDIFELAKATHPTARTVLVTDDTMDRYSASLGGREDVLVDHVIANRLPSQWTANEFRVTLQKLCRGDLFGLEKYVAPGTMVHHLTVRGSVDRENHNRAVMEFADANRLGHYMSKLAFGISEELLMNAIRRCHLLAMDRCSESVSPIPSVP